VFQQRNETPDQVALIGVQITPRPIVEPPAIACTAPALLHQAGDDRRRFVARRIERAPHHRGVTVATEDDVGVDDVALGRAQAHAARASLDGSEAPALTQIGARVRRGQRGVCLVEARLRLPLALLGLVWSGAMICYLTAVETISVSLAVLILYFYPLLVLIYSVMRGGGEFITQFERCVRGFRSHVPGGYTLTFAPRMG